MKITKYDQACLLIETLGKRILIDPGNIGFTTERLCNDWTNIDAILVTHKHPDHCHIEAIDKIITRDTSICYSSKEVIDRYNLFSWLQVKVGDVFTIGKIKVTVVKAVHGFLTIMKENDLEVKENIGYIIDDGKVRVYITSDTINFNNDHKCDVLCMPFNGNGLTMGLIDGLGFIRAINPKLVIPIHMQHPLPYMNPNINELKQMFETNGINYKILEVKDSIIV